MATAGEIIAITARSTWTGIRRQVAAMGRMVKRMGSLVKDVRELFVFLAACSKEMLAEIGRNTHLKRVIQVIEAMPRDLGVDIIRLDDAWGETWGLPLQACGSWESFCDLLQGVVYAGKPGLDQVASGQFAITLAKRGDFNLNSFSWDSSLEKKLHIEQAIVVPRAYSRPSKGCPFPGCCGTTVLEVKGKMRCSTCGRQAAIRRRPQSIINIQHASDQSPEPQPGILPTSHGLGSPPIQLVGGEYQHFRRLQFQEPAKPVQNSREILHRLVEDFRDVTANAYSGNLILQVVEVDNPWSPDETVVALKHAVSCLGRAIISGELPS
ncbi:predicted protein [Chaetomium globosum CBS 148.51]|uniref:Ubiquitin-like domain-containing protein n=1 Tax=Chaetomium globosum (strain ATCC 6205 / CBS 148.51 / DSM 1962 / NBRC 6347 / NRRL 1970) TaxID=306901 RepID=Q2H9S9_CHAGB|nr:uncharacterized protein CHGG_03025 [Chaetomium globosum CBS 148.51]EAQ91090.1 predicted protein [Chaetomium globosum CBS 148.51]